MKRVKRRASKNAPATNRRKRASLLTRPEMMSILCYCNHMFWNDFVRRAYMIDSTPDDVAGDVKVFVWQAVIKYRAKPYTEVLKLGFVTAKNRLTSISRTNLTRPDAPVDIKDFLPFLKDTSSDPAKQVEFLNLLRRAAYDIVGMQRAELLLEASKFDWSLRNRRLMTGQHSILCKKLDMTPHEIYRHVLTMRDVMRKNYASKAEIFSVKENGLWTQQR